MLLHAQHGEQISLLVIGLGDHDAMPDSVGLDGNHHLGVPSAQ